MESTDIRQQLLEYIAHADDDKIQALYSLVNEDLAAINILQRHRQLIHEALKKDQDGATYSPWEEVIQRIRKKHGL